MFSDGEREFIEKHRVAHLATVDADGCPHVVPIVYALLGDYVYFVIDEKPKKTRRNLKRLRNIAANSRVAIIIDRYEEDWTRLGYLLVQGQAKEVDDAGVYHQALERLRQRYPQYRQMRLAMETNPMVRIVPTAKHFWLASAGSP